MVISKIFPSGKEAKSKQQFTLVFFTLRRLLAYAIKRGLGGRTSATSLVSPWLPHLLPTNASKGRCLTIFTVDTGKFTFITDIPFTRKKSPREIILEETSEIDHIL